MCNDNQIVQQCSVAQRPVKEGRFCEGVLRALKQGHGRTIRIHRYFTSLFTYFGERVGRLRMNDDEGAYSFMNPSILRTVEIPLPPMDLQLQFVHVTRKVDQLRAHQREAERQAEHLFQTLLHRAFSGELGGGDKAVVDGLSRASRSVLRDEIEGEMEQMRMALE